MSDDTFVDNGCHGMDLHSQFLLINILMLCHEMQGKQTQSLASNWPAKIHNIANQAC